MMTKINYDEIQYYMLNNTEFKHKLILYIIITSIGEN